MRRPPTPGRPPWPSTSVWRPAGPAQGPARCQRWGPGEAGPGSLANAVGVVRVRAPVPSYWCSTVGSKTGRGPASTAVKFTVKLTLFPCRHYLHHPNATQCCRATRKCAVLIRTPRRSPHTLSEPREPTLMASGTGLMGSPGNGRQVQVPPRLVSRRQGGLFLGGGWPPPPPPPLLNRLPPPPVHYHLFPPLLHLDTPPPLASLFFRLSLSSCLSTLLLFFSFLSPAAGHRSLRLTPLPLGSAAGEIVRLQLPLVQQPQLVLLLVLPGVLPNDPSAEEK